MEKRKLVFYYKILIVLLFFFLKGKPYFISILMFLVEENGLANLIKERLNIEFIIKKKNQPKKEYFFYSKNTI